MPVPQAGIFALGTRYHHHLLFELTPGADAARLREVLAPVQAPTVTVGGANIVIGVEPGLWGRAAPAGGSPPVAVDIPRLDGMPVRQPDLWVWLHGGGPDVLLDVARATAAQLAGYARLTDEQPGFLYHDSRDMTGFEDGTANPPLPELPELVLLPDGAPGAAGAHALTQRWVHDLAAFHALALPAQEAVFGRTKLTSEELAAADRPPDSHLSRVIVTDDGAEREILRRSVPYGTAARQGLFFVAFSADPQLFARMLRRMAGEDGPRDRLLRYSRPELTAGWFVPSATALLPDEGRGAD